MVILIIAVVILVAALILQRMSYLKEIETIETQHDEEIKEERADAIKRSKAVKKGAVFEQLIPIFPDFPYDPEGCKFLGKPVDFVVFDKKEYGYDIIFVDVKTGKASLTLNQAAIQKAIKEGYVRFETWRIGEDNKITIKS